MPAITPTSTVKASLGPYHLYCYKFAATANHGDTFASGLTGIASWWVAQADSSGTQASTGASASESSGTFTLGLAENASAVHLFVVAKGS
jgi:hypothetical protein